MSITKNHESYDVTVLDNPLTSLNAPVRENDVTMFFLVVNSQFFFLLQEEYAKLVSQLKLETLVKEEVAEFAGGLYEVMNLH